MASTELDVESGWELGIPPLENDTFISVGNDETSGVVLHIPKQLSQTLRHVLDFLHVRVESHFDDECITPGVHVSFEFA